LNSRILEPGPASAFDSKSCFRAVGFGFSRKSLAGKDPANEVPDSAVPPALTRVRAFMGAGTRESRMGQVGIEALDGTDDRITEGDSFLPFWKRQEQWQSESGENSARHHQPYSPHGSARHAAAILGQCWKRLAR